MPKSSRPNTVVNYPYIFYIFSYLIPSTRMSHCIVRHNLYLLIFHTLLSYAFEGRRSAVEVKHLSLCLFARLPSPRKMRNSKRTERNRPFNISITRDENDRSRCSTAALKSSSRFPFRYRDRSSPFPPTYLPIYHRFAAAAFPFTRGTNDPSRTRRRAVRVALTCGAIKKLRDPEKSGRTGSYHCQLVGR